MAGKFNTESVSIPTGTARGLALLPARAMLVAAAASAPGYCITILSQNFVTFPSWLGWAAPVINFLGYQVLPG